ncbi:unnamed protein product [Ixodes pacificus]
MSKDTGVLALHELDADEWLVKEYKIKTLRCGTLPVHVQGDLSKLNPRKPVFLTMHDVGSTYLDFVKFATHSAMKCIQEKSVFLHVEVPGQTYEAPDLPDDYKFPSLDDLAHEMVSVLHYFKIPYCVALGEGAGANVLARLTINNPELVLGSILIHCNAMEANMLELFNYRVMYWNQTNEKTAPPLEHFLVFHKFGKVFSKLLEQSGFSQIMSTNPASSKSSGKDVVMEYTKSGQKMNRKNSCLYISSYLTRSDISSLLKDHCKTDVLLVTSSNPIHADVTQAMHRKIDPSKAALVSLDDVEDILTEAPKKLAYSLILFCQGLGLLSSLPITSLTSLMK